MLSLGPGEAFDTICSAILWLTRKFWPSRFDGLCGILREATILYCPGEESILCLGGQFLKDALCNYLLNITQSCFFLNVLVVGKQFPFPSVHDCPHGLLAYTWQLFQGVHSRRYGLGCVEELDKPFLLLLDQLFYQGSNLCLRIRGQLIMTNP